MLWFLLVACERPPEDSGYTCLIPEQTVTDEGHPADGWAWERLGLVNDTTASTAGDGDLAPTLAVYEGSLYLFFARKEGIESRLWWTHSEDGVHFVAPTPVDGVPAGNALYPSIAVANGRGLLWVASGALDLYESSDFASWNLVSSGVMRGEAGEFDALSILYPSVIADPTGWRMLYTGFDGAKYRIGGALSADGQSWARMDRVALEAAPGFDNAAVAQPALLAQTDGWWLWYGGYDTSQTDPGPWRVGLARSLDGVFYERMGVSLPLAPEGTDAWSTRDPAVIWYEGAWRMVYVGMGTDGVYRLHLATSPACP